MNKDKELKIKRAKFVQAAIDDPKLAAKHLRKLADGLANTKRTSDILYALRNILYLSDKTLLRDFKSDDT